MNSRGEQLARVFGLRLQALEKIRGFLRVAGGGEDRAGIVFQDGEPALQVSRMILADFRSNAKIATKETCSYLAQFQQFCHQPPFEVG